VSDVRIEHRYCTRRKSLDSRFDSDGPLHRIHARVRISEVPNRNLWDAHPHRHSLVSLGFVAFVLFGFVSFLNAWNAGSSTKTSHITKASSRLFVPTGSHIGRADRMFLPAGMLKVGKI
jgi:hypothetical protein